MKQKESINKEHLEGNSGSSLDWSILEDSSEKRNLSMENDSNASSFTVHSENMRDFPEKTSAKERIATLRQIGATAMRAMGIKFSQLKVRHKQEQPPSVKSEFVQSNVIEDEISNVSQEAMPPEPNASEQEDEDLAKMHQELINEMEGGYRRNKKLEFQKQRIQEIIERDFNQRLLTIDKLEEYVLSGEQGISKCFERYEGKEIPVYDLEGVPFCMFNHDIEYRAMGGKATGTSQRNLASPSFWTLDKETAMKEKGFVANSKMPDTGEYAMGNTICISYINSEHNLNTRVSHHVENGTIKYHVCYGFSHIDGRRIIRITNGDGNNPITKEDGANELGDVDYVKNVLEGQNGHTVFPGYNEIFAFRYSDDGKPMPPDYIIAEDGQITDDMKRHAAFFKVPIVNINTQSYYNRMQERAEEILDSVDENSNYESIESARKALASIGLFNTKAAVRLTQTGNMAGEESQAEKELRRAASTDLKYRPTFERIAHLKALELEKRAAYISEKLAQASDAYAEAWRDKREYLPPSDGIGLKVTYTKASGAVYDEKNTYVGAKQPCANLVIEMAMPDGEKITTKYIDGRKLHDGQNGSDGNGDSTGFHRVFPQAYSYLYNARQYNNARSELSK